MIVEQILNQKINFTTNIILIEIADDCLVIANTLVDYITSCIQNKKLRYWTADKNFSYYQFIKLHQVPDLFADKSFEIVNYQGSSQPSAEQIRSLPLLTISDPGSIKKIIIVCEKFDYKQKKTKSYQTLMQSVDSIVVNGDKQDLMVWAKYLLSNHHITIDNQALFHLLNLNLNNIQSLYQNLQQLSYFYLSDKSSHITIENITKFFHINSSKHNIFMLSHAYLKGNLKQAFHILDQLIANDSGNILICWILTDDIRKLLTIKSMIQNNVKPAIKNISDKLYVFGERLQNLIAAANRVSYRILLETLNDLAIIDLINKGLILNDNGINLKKCMMRLL